ncbi:GAF domain-containing protein [Pseudanabaena sp. Chao 1811]|uniref:GAF domain-containing protein n=1 Tax=Pseudanabaena sp. Chao 1811 TaxID=2963092 RepID=UPI0022F38C39|nr:GAF domain-containing protein [Pseudanabaena sp. Chao 1811]
MLLNIPEYQIIDKIHDGGDSQVYRGVRTQDNLSVVLKVLNAKFPDIQTIGKYKKEYEITKSFTSDLIISAYDFKQYQNSFVIILEDFGGESLNHFLTAQQSDLIDSLKLAIQISESVGQIHVANIIHKDINPSNIVFNPKTKQLKIIDFGIASSLPKETLIVNHHDILEGTLAYMSPEQTGRMNRSLDYRTDIYSMGVTFYQMLTGRLPFTSDDPLELIHHHLALEPISPHLINAQIPFILSQIILKLLAKNAEERYQSVWGVKADLEKCLEQLQTQGKIAHFDLAQQDITDKFLIPEKLYGRSKEISSLLAAFSKVMLNNVNHDPNSDRLEVLPEIVLISGYAGIGKSRLVKEVHRLIGQNYVHFIIGKFDQYQRNIPYLAIIQAFQGLIKHLLTEDEDRLNQWRSRLITALGTNSYLITQVIPDLELIIAKQEHSSEISNYVSASDAQNRFNRVFQNFIHVFAQSEHPLVIFLDDLQWADRASLKLLQILATTNAKQSLMLVAAYRNNEVNAAHPMMQMIDNIQKANGEVCQLFLSTLNLTDITQLITDTLHCVNTDALPLAELVRQKTGGNPFFMNEFLKSLYDERLIGFNYQFRQWEWSITQIQEREITDNVVGLMAGKIQKLNPDTQRLLQIAACIGNEFDLDLLVFASDLSYITTIQCLIYAIAEGLLLPLSNAYQSLYYGIELTSDCPIINYKFVHDRIQQAAYSLISDTDRSAFHYRIGKLLLDQTEHLSEKLEEQIFRIVNQFRLGSSQITTQQERDYLVQLYLLAGRKARLSYAYESSVQYCEMGIQLLSEDAWERYPQITQDIYLEAITAACLAGRFELVDVLIDVAKPHFALIQDQIKLIEVQIQSLIARNRLPEAIAIGLEILHQLGVEIPQQPDQQFIDNAFKLISQKLSETEDVLHLPVMDNPQKLSAINTLSNISSAAYIGFPALYPLIVLKQIELSLQFGNTLETAYAFSTYGLILCVIGKIEEGNQAADIALAVMQKLHANNFKAKIFNLIYHFIRPWKEPARQAIAPLLEGYQAGVESGDLEFAAYCLFNHCQIAYFSGENLLTLKQDMAIYGKIIANLKQVVALNFHQIGQQAVLNFLDEAENPQFLIGEVYNEIERLPLHLASGDTYSTATAYIQKLILSYHFASPQEALAIAKLANQAIGGATGAIQFGAFYFYHALTLLANTEITDEITAADIANPEILNDLDKLSSWAVHAPTNFAHRCDLVRAEMARVMDQKMEAMDLYDQAIAFAKENQYIHEEALANELAAKFYLGYGKTTIAKAYMQEARQGYLQWGAFAKVKHLESCYPELLEILSTNLKADQNNHINRATQSSSNNLASLELGSFLRASQAIANEIKLDQLLETLMNILIENAGAQTGYLLLPRHLSISANSSNQNQWTIAAIKTISYEHVVLQSIAMDTLSIDGTYYIPLSVVNYVIRTHERVVLHNATQIGDFQNDPWIVQYQSKSLLCMPLINRGNLSAIVLLENNLITDAFTPERLEVLNLLSTQAAISISKARLLKQQDQLNQTLQAEIGDRLLAEKALQEQNQRTQIFAEVSLKIRQSIELQEILQTTVTEIQRVLKADRVIIYQINSDKTGRVAAESVVPSCQSLINQEIFDPCFEECVEKYAQGGSTAINNIDNSDIKPCHADFLKQFGVKANLVVPILQTDQLWGLLIVHQCDHPRDWTEFETEFLVQLANQLGIALFQSQLVSSLRQNEHSLNQLNEELEHRVMQRTAELEAVNKELESFSYSVSHDLRAPLRAVVGFSRMLQEDYSDRLDTEGNRFLKVVRDNAKRMGELIDNLLDLSRLNRKEMLRRSISVNNLIQQLLSDFAPEIASRQIEFIFGDLPDCQADISLLTQVWINLLSNAIKYTSKTDHARIEIGSQTINGEIVYFIRDNGAGFDMQYADKLFGVFQRMHLDREFEGTGIGLAIVQRIVQRHGGHIWAEAAINQGATFYFTIPNR